MTAIALASAAYQNPARALRTPRAVEYDAFTRVTAALANATTQQSRIVALHRNRELWRLMAEMVADPSNSLPPPLRAQVFYLYEFTTQHTSALLAGHGEIDALIDVNRAVMAGLSKTGDRAA